MFVKPEAIVKNLDILPGMKVADFGAGAGFYTLPIAKRVGAAGKVYALDIRKEILELIRSKAREARLFNVDALRADLDDKEGSHLKSGSVDMVMISNILFQIENKKGLAEEAYRILRVNGRVVLVEWDEEKKSSGPPLAQRVNRRDAEEVFLKCGFVFEKEFNAGENHYGLIFKKQ
jgi:ubiquinone/menaquinone biosynthesis C-methylase UbiE